jgi:UDP-N-acetylglucosamine/UDP-N-acetylgalactosamine diphosphorylase
VTSDPLKQQLLQRLTPFGQQHLLHFWDQLDDAQRNALAEQIATIDFALLDRVFHASDDHAAVRTLADQAESPPAVRLTGQNPFSPADALRVGREALAAGRVGVLLVAGGQGTRLGFDHPKGMFPIGPVSGRSLFQVFVEKIQATAHRYGVRIPLYLMTSHATHEETIAFFRDHARFGLAEEDLFVFRQGTLPAADARSGQLLLAAPDRLFASPDGHGGMLAGLARNGGLADMQRRGLRHLFYFQVDNPLVDIAGAEFLGYHVLSGSEMTTQVVAKQDPLEKVGNVVRAQGAVRVIEYSDLPDDVARRRTPDGSLAIWAGSIGVHAIEVAFLDRMASRDNALPLHRAHKKVPHVDASGQLVKPSQPNAIKFERFIFDLLPSARNAIVVEVDPAQAFAPLKNGLSDPKDNAQTVRAQMVAQHRAWLRRAGVEVPDHVQVEISPLLAMDAEELRAKIAPGARIAGDTYLS